MKHKTKHEQRYIITQEEPKSPISEAFRTLRTNIQFSSLKQQEIRSMMVTSSGPNEGKSTVSANLAVVFAQSGKKTLFIDADLRKPTVHHTFRLNNREGLTNILTGQRELEQVCKETSIKHLNVLTAGPIPPNPAELISSKAMDMFINEACESYDMILFDTPPLIAVTDAQILSSKLDGVVLVLNSGKTNRDMGLKAKGLLEKVDARILGCVLNNRKLEKNHDYYYYYGKA
ncbi:CpsD/CapB family tyrosine-protein kinase [Bacillus horti]|uniref:non-specific protein-tyrosine kinase n=1 Tax=Caldalkalibacillus horti TaxID=77523 RepID=A0ABT9VZY4_9BACI|nr:CpsD/CapB family tyrosine-protein kinase [Bacillus horti]MDQ0166382.1 capsular exopolysaccharide synthesis family protein [Bacillus horti]